MMNIKEFSSFCLQIHSITGWEFNFVLLEELGYLFNVETKEPLL